MEGEGEGGGGYSMFMTITDIKYNNCTLNGM